MPLGNPIQKNNDTRIVSATATTGQTEFTVTGGYTVNNISVILNGHFLQTQKISISY